MDFIPIHHLLLYAAAGAVIGFVHFGGLWLTVKKSGDRNFAPGFFFVGFLVRSAITVSAIYFITAGKWWAIMSCTAGLLLVRRIWITGINRKKMVGAKGVEP